MSIDYQSHSEAATLAKQMQDEYNLENPETPPVPRTVDAEFSEINTETGEVIENEADTM